MALPIAAAVVIRDGRVLLVRRRVPEGTLSWQFPAGKIEPGEAPEEAAVRETEEETALRVTPYALLGRRVHPTTAREIHYVACRAPGDTPVRLNPRELDRAAWLTRPEIPHTLSATLHPRSAPTSTWPSSDTATSNGDRRPRPGGSQAAARGAGPEE